jgi:hypothetical protein
MRPSTLVENKFGAVISSIDTNTGIISVSNIPTTFSTGLEYDFTESRTPNKLLGYDKTATVNSTLNTITFAPADLPSELKVGDYITLAEETIVPHLPVELHPTLAQRAAVHCLHALGDQQSLQSAEAKLAQMEQKTVDLIDNRVEDSPQKIINLHSPLKQSLYSNRNSRKWRR